MVNSNRANPLCLCRAGRWTSALLLLLCGVSPALADPNSITARIDDVFSNIELTQPGCNVGIIHRGNWLHKSGYGLANMELDMRLDGSQAHRMASVSKQFTAMAVLLLAEAGEVDLADDIRTHLPELPDYSGTVTINAMLGHVAGMGDYELIEDQSADTIQPGRPLLRSAAGGPFRLGNEDYLTIEEFYRVVRRLPLIETPGTRYLYSNLAYFLLSMLVEEVSGETLREYAQRRMFGPLGMTSSFFSDDPVEIVRNRASGYTRGDDGGYITDMTNLFWVGDGGLHSTLDDMLLWDRNFYQPKTGTDPAALMTLMNQPNSQHAAEGQLYANGQFVGSYQGHDVYQHSGGWLGTSTYYGRFPDLQASLIMMCNDTSLDTEALVEATLSVLIDYVTRPDQ